MWRARQRRLDLEFLWPALKRDAPSLERAKQAFAIHAHQDPAWRALDQGEVNRIIDGLA